jgi:dienelactone hydrolase
MKRNGHLLKIAVAAGLAPALAQFAPAPMESYKLTGAEERQIRARLNEIGTLLEQLRSRHTDDALVADVAVYQKAADWALRYPEEFYKKEYAANALAVLETGIQRAKLLAAGKAPWASEKGRLIRGYRSRIDGSYQPYGLIIPDSYDGVKPVRLDVMMHGRGRTLSEVSFIAAHDGLAEISEGAFGRKAAARPIPSDQDFIQLDVFGRANNGYRWAAETDVWEALASVQQRYKIDPARIVLRGFSMGGHGAWHLGLHYPDRWAAVEAGAGFTDTKVYGKQTNLTPWQEAAIHIYDSQDYALNAFDVPIVGYAGENDPQRKGMDNIRRQLERDGFTFREEPLRWTSPDLNLLFLIGPKAGHQFHPESKKESEAYIRKMLAQPRNADHIRFVTWTTRYNHCFWVTVDGLEKHYERAEVDARRINDGRDVTVRTVNVSRLILDQGQAVTLDGQNFKLASYAGPHAFEKKGGRWAAARAEEGGRLRKQHGLQGPIDDFTLDSFLVVRPTGKPMHPLANEYAQAAMDQAIKEFAKWLRGDMRVKDDRLVTKEDIANNTLVLFGDPGSNSILAQAAGKLPIRWTRQSVALGKQTFSAADHVPVLIYPNPLHPRRYIVINSGHTFHAADLEGTNALQYPRLGDFALMKVKKDPNGAVSGEVAAAGIFGESWELPAGFETRPGRKQPSSLP